MLKQLVDYVVRQLVDKPENVLVEVFDETSQVVVHIKVALDDFKRVIGKDGRVIKAIRAMAFIVNPSPEKQIIVDIVK